MRAEHEIERTIMIHSQVFRLYQLIRCRIYNFLKKQRSYKSCRECLQRRQSNCHCSKCSFNALTRKPPSKFSSINCQRILSSRQMSCKRGNRYSGGGFRAHVRCNWKSEARSAAIPNCGNCFLSDWSAPCITDLSGPTSPLRLLKNCSRKQAPPSVKVTAACCGFALFIALL